MDVLDRLDQVKPYNGFTSLSHGYHTIEQFRSVKNRYAKKKDGEDETGPSEVVLVDLVDQVVFLNDYWSEKIYPEMDVLNESIKNGRKVYLFFGGKYKKTQ